MPAAVIGAILGGFVFSTLLGFQYYPGINLATIFVATIGAVLFLWGMDWFRGRGRIEDRRR